MQPGSSRLQGTARQTRKHCKALLLWLPLLLLLSVLSLPLLSDDEDDENQHCVLVMQRFLLGSCSGVPCASWEDLEAQKQAAAAELEDGKCSMRELM